MVSTPSLVSSLAGVKSWLMISATVLIEFLFFFYAGICIIFDTRHLSYVVDLFCFQKTKDSVGDGKFGNPSVRMAVGVIRLSHKHSRGWRQRCKRVWCPLNYE